MRLMIAALLVCAGAGTALADDTCAQWLPEIKAYAADVHKLLEGTEGALPSSTISDVRAGNIDAAKADARDELIPMFETGSDEIVAWAEATIDLLPALDAQAKAVDAAIALLESCAG